MTEALKIRAELEAELMAARAQVICCDDASDFEGSEQARCRCNAALDALLHLPEARGRQ